MSTTTSTSINTALAAEYLQRQLAVEAAQRANVPEIIHVLYITDQATMTAHLRSETTMTNPGAATEASSLPEVQWSPSSVTISAGLDGQAVTFSKVINSLDGDALASVARQQGSALARSIDLSLMSLATSLTAGSVLGSGTSHALTVSDCLTANANLDAAYANVAGPYRGRLHAHQFANLYQDIMSKNFGIAKITVDAMGREQIDIGGAVFEKNNLTTADGSNLYWNGFVASEQAMALAIAQNPSVQVLDVPGKHAFSIDATVVYGVGVWRPTFGALIYSSKTA